MKDDEWEKYELELQEFENEIEEIQNELEKDNLIIEEGFEWYDILVDLEENQLQFNNNIESLKKCFSLYENENDSNFLSGTLLIGFVSAYEGFVHDFFYICLTKTSYLEKAITNASELNQKDYKQLKFKNNMTEDMVKTLFSKATLYDPVQITRISKVLFGLQMPMITKELTDKLLKFRNAYTHNNGEHNGKIMEVRLIDLNYIYNIFNNLINQYVNELVKEANKFDLNIHNKSQEKNEATQR